jgi:flagellar motor switch protein FliN/FliY
MNTSLPDLETLADGGEADGFGEFSNPLDPGGVGSAAGDPQEAELNRAIEELRGVLHEDRAGEAAAPASPELMTLQRGSTVALDRRIGEPVDVVVNGRRIACGEITVLENDPSRFGIKLTQIIDASKPG